MESIGALSGYEFPLASNCVLFWKLWRCEPKALSSFCGGLYAVGGIILFKMIGGRRQ